MMNTELLQKAMDATNQRMYALTPDQAPPDDEDAHGYAGHVQLDDMVTRAFGGFDLSPRHLMAICNYMTARVMKGILTEGEPVDAAMRGMWLEGLLLGLVYERMRAQAEAVQEAEAA